MTPEQLVEGLRLYDLIGGTNDESVSRKAAADLRVWLYLNAAELLDAMRIVLAMKQDLDAMKSDPGTWYAP